MRQPYRRNSSSYTCQNCDSLKKELAALEGKLISLREQNLQKQQHLFEKTMSIQKLSTELTFLKKAQQ